MIEAKLYAKLKTVADHVYPVVAPRGYSTPAVIYNRISTETERNLDNDSQTSGWVTFQVDVYDPVLLAAKTKARAIRTALKGWSDPDIQSVTFVDEKDMIDDTTDVTLCRTMAFYAVFVTDGL